jgi:lipoprotein Spr
MKRSVFIIFIFSSLFSFSQHSVLKDSLRADSLLTFSKKFLGTKYNYGNCSPKSGFDCSGFVYYVFSHFNIKVPRSSMDYEKSGRLIRIDSCRKGDVIVFTGTNIKNRTPGHVGIIISDPGEPIKFIHSSSGKNCGVIITNFSESAYYQKRFIKIARIAVVY